MRKSLSALVLLAISSLAAAQQSMDNAAVIKLLKAGLSDDLIVNTINGSPGKYDTSADGLIALKNAGADSKVVAAVLMKLSGGTPIAPATPAHTTSLAAPVAAAPVGPPPGIESVGVYYKNRSGAWKPLLPEIVDFKSGGVIKNIASADVVRRDVNGHIQGPHARVSAEFPFVFAVYLPEGASISEYQLLRLHENGNSREFRSVTGGMRVLHASGGPVRDLIDFQSEEIAPRVYQISLHTELGKGEYGLLPPGALDDASSGSNGKIYAVSLE